MLAHGAEDLQNASTIAYPTRKPALFAARFLAALNEHSLAVDLAEALLKTAQADLQRLSSTLEASVVNADLSESAILFCHGLTNALVPSAAAAYTASIEKYERRPPAFWLSTASFT